MEELGADLKALERAAKGKEPLGPEAVRRAEAALAKAREIPGLFPEASRGKKGSRETPQIWSDWSGFVRAADAFEAEASKLLVAVRANDKAALRAGLKSAAAACADCHERYRAAKR